MRTFVKGPFRVVSRSIRSINLVRWWGVDHVMSPSFVYLASHYTTASTSSYSIESTESMSSWLHQSPKGKNCIEEIFLDPEEEVYAQRIRKAILKVKIGSAEDVIQSLESDESCSTIKLTSCLVDTLLQKFGDDWKSALGFFEWASTQKGYKHTPFACDRMVDLLGKMRQMNLMWDLLNKMHTGGIVTLNTLAKVMRRLAGARKWRDALELFDHLEYFGFPKNIDTMNLLLETLCKEKRMDVAREAYLLLKAHIPPNAYTFNIFVYGWCKAGKLDEAMWTIQEMRSLGFQPSVITYSTLLHAYCDQLNFRKAHELLDKMTDEGCPPNVVTYTGIMNSLAKSGQVNEALGVVDRMKICGCKPDTLFYNSLINIVGKAGRLEEASHIFEVEMKINSITPDLSTYNTMISIFCHHLQLENALNILKEMESLSYKPDLQTYRPLLRLCFLEGQLEGIVESLLSDMINKHHLSLDLDTYTLLINGLCRIGNIAWATLLFDEMIGREILPRSQTCMMLMHEAESRSLFLHVERIKILVEHVQSSRQCS